MFPTGWGKIIPVRSAREKNILPFPTLREVSADLLRQKTIVPNGFTSSVDHKYFNLFFPSGKVSRRCLYLEGVIHTCSLLFTRSLAIHAFSRLLRVARSFNYLSESPWIHSFLRHVFYSLFIWLQNDESIHFWFIYNGFPRIVKEVDNEGLIFYPFVVIIA